MDLTTITIAQFKALFLRDFPYFSDIQYDAAATYNTGDEVYYPTTKLFYSALVDGVTATAPTDATKWVKVADSIDNYIQDADITKAFAEALAVVNQSLFGNDDIITMAFLYMAAHYLSNDIKVAMGGVSSSAAFPMQSRSAGSVSVSYAVPEAFIKNPIYAMYAQTGYGMKYLALAMPSMTGNMVGICADTNP